MENKGIDAVSNVFFNGFIGRSSFYTSISENLSQRDITELSLKIKYILLEINIKLRILLKINPI